MCKKAFVQQVMDDIKPYITKHFDMVYIKLLL